MRDAVRVVLAAVLCLPAVWIVAFTLATVGYGLTRWPGDGWQWSVVVAISGWICAVLGAVVLALLGLRAAAWLADTTK